MTLARTETPGPAGTGAPFDGVRSIADFLRVWLERGLLEPDEERLLHDYYRKFRRLRSERMQAVYAEQIREAQDLVRARPGLKVLEVGTGCGTEALWLAVNGADVTSIDVAPHYTALAERRREVLQEALGRPLACRFRTCPVLDLAGTGEFDLVWMEQTFHHLEPREACVRIIAGLVRPGGWLIISEANGLNPLLQLQLLLFRGTRTVVATRRPDGSEYLYGNERVLSAFTLRALFARQGIACERIRYFRFFPSHPAFDRLGWIDRKVATRWLLPFHTHYNYVGRKV